jgi:hypothetical protein
MRASRPNVRVQLNEGALRRAAGMLIAKARQIEPHEVTVGIHAAEGEQPKQNYQGRGGSASLIETALTHEFGGGAQPDRSWLRTWVDQNHDRLEREMVRSMCQAFRGNHSEMQRQAGAWRDELRAWIAEQEGHLVALSPETVERKSAAGLPRPDVPLYATGQLVQAIAAVLDGGRT